ncbi:MULTISPECIES: pitrilysin family protein [unclassified Ectothiorhodospira]|uniref:M16 family metallopeptidase n=1 Tax=unclassified Ectothiorhodospira TaxID=2684909 RepID=UPI001EE8EB20|nr:MULTISPECIES: pitrilysin family protein [unclassified Ectothiorhodospira]MCG5515614.1 insulinase family protein [Ectothiorhodospira sp. 9100]MCG5518862.1 insulinase family protein [Ectothiorhodospira sp. 9905]
MKQKALLLCLALLLFGTGPALAGSGSDVFEYELDNGMKVLVRPDTRAPVVSSMVWYRVGASHEHGGITGVSHALEHMMFKGTEAHPAGEFSRIIAELGGRENAFTSRDYTAYFQQLAARHLDRALELEADRMQNLALPEDAFVQEMRVVREERRLRTEDNPNALTREHFNATAWLNSPYGMPVIGWMVDIDEYTVADMRDWYERWYAPNNALLVVVGDVDPDHVHEMAKAHFGDIPAQALPEVKSRTEARQLGERRITVKAPARVPQLLMGYKVPVLLTAEASWEPYALLVASGVLDGGESARIPRELERERELVASAGVSYTPFSRLDNLFMVSATPSSDADRDEVEQALIEALERLKDEPVSASELERVKAQVVARDVYRRDSIQGQAMQLGMLESVGLSWEEGERFAERVRAVTAEQVQEVARRYFDPHQRTVAWLDPQPIDPDDPPSNFEGHLR